MKQSFLGVKEAIAQANVQMQEYSNTIREINWSYFDTAQERFQPNDSGGELLRKPAAEQEAL